MSDEVEVEGVQIAPIVEEILHSAQIEVRKIPIAPGEDMTLLRFHTPYKVYTVKLDQNGVDVVIDNLRGKTGSPDILIARPGDVPNLKAVT